MIDVYPEYVGLAVLNVVGILYLLAKKFKWFEGGKATSKASKAKSEDLEPIRRSNR